MFKNLTATSIALLLATLLFSTTSLLADWKQPVNTLNADLMDENSGQQVDVGFGFSTEKDKIIYNTCLNAGEHQYVIAPKSFNYLNRRWSQTDLRQYFGLDISTNVGFLVFRKSDSSKFVFETVEKSYAESFTYFNKIEFGRKVHKPECIDDGNGGCSHFNSLGKLHLGNPERFKRYCGDLYVHTMETGADLFLQANLVFYNRKDKARFEGKYDFSILPFADISAKVRAELDSFIDLGEIQIVGIQRGGVPAELNKILSKEVTQCSFKNLEACEKTIASLITYAKEEWPKQLKDPTDDKVSIVRKYETQDYGTFHHEDPSAEPNVPLEVSAARVALGLKYFEIMDDRNTVAYNLTVVNDRNGYDYRRRLLEIEKIVDINMERVRAAGELCFEQLDKCAANAKLTLETLTEFERDNLDLDKNRDRIKKIISAYYHTPGVTRCSVHRGHLHNICEGEPYCNIYVDGYLCHPPYFLAETFSQTIPRLEVTLTCDKNPGGSDAWQRGTRAHINCDFI